MRIIVVGGGIAGSFTAFFLSQQGADVLVISEPPTYPSVGLVLSVLLASPSDVELAARSLAIYRSLEDEAGRLVHPFPVYEIFPSRAEIPGALMDAWHRVGEKVERLNWSEAGRELGLRLKEGEWVLGGGRDYVVSVKKVVSWLHRHLRVLRGRARLRRMGGRIEVLYRGNAIRGDSVVVAAGAWNKELLKGLDIDAPLVTYGARAVLLLGPRILSRISISDNVLSFYSRPTDKSMLNALGLYLAGNSNVPGITPRDSWSVGGDYIDRLKQAIRMRFNASPIHVWSGKGVLEMGLDHFPLAGCLECDTGLYIIGGLDGYGATIGPALAEILASTIIKGQASIGLPCHDASRFSSRRHSMLPDIEWEPFLLYPPPPPTANSRCFNYV